MSPKVELMHVTKKYENLVALNDLNLTINNGEYLILLGPTGSGKTTTLLIIAGLVQPEKGSEIYIDNLNVNNIPTENRNIGFVFAQYAKHCCYSDRNSGLNHSNFCLVVFR